MSYNQIPLSFQELLDTELQNLMSTESALMLCLSGWKGAGLSKALDQLLRDYLDLVKTHNEKLNRLWEGEERKLTTFKNDVTLQLIEDSKSMLDRCTDTEIREACLLSGIQKINHLKISGLDTASIIAQRLNLSHPALVLHHMAGDEKDFEKSFLHLSRDIHNNKA